MDEPHLTRAQLLRRAAAAGIVLTATRAGLELPAAAAAGRATTHRFVSRPELLPPVLSIRHHEQGATAPGLLFTAPNSGPGARGTLLVDDSGEVVWFHPTTPVTAMNFRAAVYRGKPVLTWWEGKTEHGLGEGSHVILDSSYRLVQRFPAGRGRPSDLHEFLLTDRGTALVTAWEVREANLSPYGGPLSGQVIGGVVQELALPSGRVLFEWRSLDHVGLDESHAKIGPRWDYFHINSIERDAAGDYLVSARNTWGIYKIDGETGKVLWRLGGKRSDFTMGPGTVFAWQHDARSHSRDRISLFDDGGRPRVQPWSKALVLALDHKRKRASVHRRYLHHPPAEAWALGSVQLLPNGNVLVGWGTAPYISEHTDGGRLVLDAELPSGGENYRALRLAWSGRPALPPAIAARPHPAGHRVYASWNGSTALASWRLETGPSTAALAVDRTVPKDGFETAVSVPTDARFVRMTALDAAGAALARSATLKLG